MAAILMTHFLYSVLFILKYLPHSSYIPVLDWYQMLLTSTMEISHFSITPTRYLQKSTKLVDFVGISVLLNIWVVQLVFTLHFGNELSRPCMGFIPAVKYVVMVHSSPHSCFSAWVTEGKGAVVVRKSCFPLVLWALLSAYVSDISHNFLV